MVGRWWCWSARPICPACPSCQREEQWLPDLGLRRIHCLEGCIQLRFTYLERLLSAESWLSSAFFVSHLSRIACSSDTTVPVPPSLLFPIFSPRSYSPRDLGDGHSPLQGAPWYAFRSVQISAGAFLLRSPSCFGRCFNSLWVREDQCCPQHRLDRRWQSLGRLSGP